MLESVRKSSWQSPTPTPWRAGGSPRTQGHSGNSQGF